MQSEPNEARAEHVLAGTDFSQRRVRLNRDNIAVPPEPVRLSRPRLLEAFDANLAACASTILTGRTSTGKSLAALDFARNSGRRLAWYSVAASDADHRGFFAHFFASLAAERPGFGSEGLRERAQSAGVEQMESVAEEVAFELDENAGEPLLAVVDNLHHVYDVPWFGAFLGRLLPVLPPDVHLVLTGRGLPPAPLWRMRSKQTLSVVDETGLAFTRDEARALFATYGLGSTTADAAFARSRGRAGLLDLEARVVAHAPLPEWAAAPRDDSYYRSRLLIA